MVTTPQQLLKNASQRPTPRLNLGVAASASIGKQFLDTAQSGLNAAAKRDAARRDKAAKAALSFNKTMLYNDLQTQVAKSSGQLADLNGIEALEKTGSIKQEFLRNIKGRLDTVPAKYKGTPEFLQFQEEMVKASGKFDRFAIGYNHSEARKVEDSAYKARIANNQNDFVDNAADINYMSTKGYDSIVEATTADLERTYGSDRSLILPGGETVGEIIDSQVATVVSDSVTKAIQQQLNVNDPDKAATTLNVFNDDIVPADRIKIMAMIDKHKKKAADTQSLAIGDEAFRMSGGNEEVALEMIKDRAGGDIAIFNKASSYASARFSAAKRQKAKQIENSMVASYDHFMKEGNLNTPAYANLPQEKKDEIVERLNKNNGGPARLTDQKSKARIEIEVNHMTPEDFIKVDIQKSYGPYLGREDLKYFKDKQDYARKKIENKNSDAQNWNESIPNKAISNFSNMLGMFRDDPAYGEFSRDVQAIYAQIKQENPRMNDTQQRKMLDSMIYDKLTVEQDSTFKFIGPNEVKNVYSLPEEGLVDRARNSDQIRDIQKARFRRGQRPMTDAQLERFLNQ